MTKPNYTDEQIIAWLRGLLLIAWSDGDFTSEEQEKIKTLMTIELGQNLKISDLPPITPAELATVLGKNNAIAENFLRTATMVAIADGVFSAAEDKLLKEFQQALDISVDALTALEHTKVDLDNNDGSPKEARVDVLRPLRHWMDDLDIHDPRLAKILCTWIPPQCPFERDIVLFGHKVIHIPPLCKLNPLYEQTVGLRFRALSYLADKCGEDVTRYCQ